MNKKKVKIRNIPRSPTTIQPIKKMNSISYLYVDIINDDYFEYY